MDLSEDKADMNSLTMTNRPFYSLPILNSFVNKCSVTSNHKVDNKKHKVGRQTHYKNSIGQNNMYNNHKGDCEVIIVKETTVIKNTSYIKRYTGSIGEHPANNLTQRPIFSLPKVGNGKYLPLPTLDNPISLPKMNYVRETNKIFCTDVSHTKMPLTNDLKTIIKGDLPTFKKNDILRFPTWDGRYIGTLTFKNIEKTGKTLHGTCWLIKFPRINPNNGKLQTVKKWCLIRKSTNGRVDQCIIDELKSIFGFGKLGTNWVLRGKTKYILVRLPFYRHQNKNIITLKEYRESTTIPPDVIKSIRKLLTFRMSIGVKEFKENSIIMKPSAMVTSSKMKYQIDVNAFGIKETIIEEEMNKLNIPTVISNRWFSEDQLPNFLDFGVILREMLDVSIEKTSQLTKMLFQLRIQMTDIFNRVHPESVWLLETIMHKLTKTLIE